MLGGRWRSRALDAPAALYLIAGIALAAGTMAIKALSNRGEFWTSGTQIYLVPAGGLSFVGAGLIARARYGARRMGLLLVAAGYAYLAEDVQLARSAVLHTIGLPLANGSSAMLILIAVLFPTGRARDRWDTAIATGAAALAFVWFPFPLVFWYDDHSVLRVLPLGSHSAGMLDFIGYIVGALGVLAVAVRLTLRIRAASPAGRWVMTPFAAAIIGWVLASLLWAGTNLAGYDALGVHVKEYSISGVEFLLDLVTIAMPWAFVAGLGRLGLARAQAVEALARLGPHPSLDQVTQALRRTLREPELELVTAADRPAPPAGRMVTELDEGTWLVHDAALGDDPALTDAIGHAVSVVLVNRRLTARIVEASDEARRKVERDVHDGPQQRLLAVGLLLERARNQAAAEAGDELTSTIARAESLLASAMQELRSLAQGEFPPVLRDFGLAAALRELVADCPVPITLRMPNTQRFPEAYELTLYFVIAEGLANALRHGRPSVIDVEVGATDGGLVCRVHDDGAGPVQDVAPTAATNGTGLRGLRDRLAAFGGELELQREAQHGTTLTAVLPLPVQSTAVNSSSRPSR